MIAIVCIVNFVCNYMPFRNSCYIMITGKFDQVTHKWNLILTTGFVVFNGIVSIVFP